MTAPASAVLDRDALQAALGLYFAPWVQALGLRVESFEPGRVRLLLPLSDALVREGGVLCGQAMMAAGDTAMVLALMTQFGGFRPMTTVQQSTSFLKPLSGQDAAVDARVLRAGRSTAFGEIDLAGASDGKTVARVSTVYALL